MAYSFEQPVFTNPCVTAVVHVDVQTVFYRTQGTSRTVAVADKLNQLVRPLRFASFSQFACFSKADNQFEAGLIPALKENDIFCFRKHAESAAQGTGLVNNLRKGRLSTVMVTGFHSASCVYETAKDLNNAGFTVIVDPQYIGEGLRGRDLTATQLLDKEKTALTSLMHQGVHIGSVSNFPTP